VPRVVAITATNRRSAELARLLASLATEGPALAGAFVVDNAASSETADIVRRAPWPVCVLAPGENVGCGGGVALGLREALRDPAVTHCWIFDDDAAATPGALTALLAALETARADAAVPLVTDAAGHIGWFPGPLTRPAWDVIRRPGLTPAEFRRTCGEAPLHWTWAPWPSLLVTRRAVETAGLPRDDYWFQGEDLEWTLRISACLAGVLVPAAECRHLPPTADDPARTFLKQALMLQNNFYTGTRLPHGRRLLRHAPGNIGRFLAANDFSVRALAAVWQSGWRGAIRGLPAGAVGGDGFRRAWERRAPG
jgi:GT2 family glycosyltransferase